MNIQNTKEEIYNLLINISENNQKESIKHYFGLLEQSLPPVLFKYFSYSDYLVNNLENHTMTFCNPNIFNDPFDSGTLFSQTGLKKRTKILNDSLVKIMIQMSKSETYKKIYSDLQRNNFFNIEDDSKRIDILKTILNDEKYKKQIDDNLILLDIKNKTNLPFFNTGDKGSNRKFGDIADNVRIFCLSENENNPLMWAHYGKNDSGICIKYSKQEILDYLYKQKENNIFLVPVYYTDTVRNSMPQSQDSPYKLLANFMIKKKEWKYEAEWRFVKFCPNYVYNPLMGRNFVAALSAPCLENTFLNIPFIEPMNIYLGAKFNLDSCLKDAENRVRFYSVFDKYSSKILYLDFDEQKLGYKIEDY